MKRSASWLALAASACLAFSLHAQTPRNGGELVFPVPSEPPSYDGHREETFGLIHPIAPFYNTLLRVDPNEVLMQADNYSVDFREVRGQVSAKRALEVASACSP